METLDDPDLFQRVRALWGEVESVYRAQEASGQWDESITDGLMDKAHGAFDSAVTIVPRTLQEASHYIAMLSEAFVVENPRAIAQAIDTLGRALDGLIAREQIGAKG